MTLMLDHVVRIAPKRVLDVGVGFGKWGFLIRELLDFTQGRLEPETWTTEIVGVEAFDYRSPLHDWVYDRMIRADVRDVVDELTGYDAVVLGDVIEHLPKDDGMALLEQLLVGNGTVVLSTPFDFFEQDIADNDHEQHLSHWTRTDFARWTYDYDVAGGAAIVVALAGAGSPYPGPRDRRISDLVYRVPGLGRRGGVARVLKQAAAAAPGR